MAKIPFGHIHIPLQRVHIELTNICNFNCVFCPKSEMTRSYGHMDLELAKSLLREIKSHGICDKVTFHIMGEPTMHPQFFDILDYARQQGLAVGLTTNGSYLNSATGRKLLDYELHQLDISLQTPDEESFHLRKAGKIRFEDYFEGILDFFRAYKAERGHNTIFKFRFLNTRFQSGEMASNKGEIRVISSTDELRARFKELAGRIHEILEVDPQIRARSAHLLDSLVSYKWNVVEIHENVFFETYLLKNWVDAQDSRQVRDAWGGYCYGMRDHFGILWNGDVVLCCQDFNGKTAVGNVTDSSLATVLNGDKLGEIMRGFRRLQLVHPYCKKCLGSAGFGSWLVRPVVDLFLLKIFKPFFYKRTRTWE